MSQVKFNSIGGPGSDAASKEIRIFGPNWKTKHKRQSCYRPIVRVTHFDAFTRNGFIMTINASRNRLDNGIQPSECLQSRRRIELTLGTNNWEVFLRVVKAAVWAAKNNGAPIFEQ